MLFERAFERRKMEGGALTDELRLTPEQQDKLSRIVNAKQRDSLLKALRAGEEIPDVAWTPIPAMSDNEQERADDMMRSTLEQLLQQSTARDAGSPVERPTVGEVKAKMEAYAQALSAPASRDEPEDGGTAALSLEGLIDELESRARDEFGLALEAVTGCEERIDDTEDSRLLFAWCYFNPYGPTLSSLQLLRDPRGRGEVLALRSEHPFTPVGALFGLLADRMPRADLGRVLAGLLAANRRQETALFGGLPSSVIVAESAPAGLARAWGNRPELEAAVVRELLRPTLSSLVTGHALTEACRYLSEYRGDPWERTKHERDEAMGRPQAQHLLETIQAIHEGETPAGQTPTEQPDEATPPSPGQFDEWFALATDAEHVASEFEQFEAAWVGSLKFGRRGVGVALGASLLPRVSFCRDGPCRRQSDGTPVAHPHESQRRRGNSRVRVERAR